MAEVCNAIEMHPLSMQMAQVTGIVKALQVSPGTIQVSGSTGPRSDCYKLVSERFKHPVHLLAAIPKVLVGLRTEFCCVL